MDLSQALVKSLLCVLVLAGAAVFFRWKRKWRPTAVSDLPRLRMHQVINVGPRQKLLVFEYDRSLKLLFVADSTARVLAEKELAKEVS